jgi:hypothetical protein
MKGFLGFITFIILNILFSIMIIIKRRNYSQKIDYKAILYSALISTLLFHIIAIIEDIKSSQWVIISIPLAFFIGLLISGLTIIILRVCFFRRNMQ